MTNQNPSGPPTDWKPAVIRCVCGVFLLAAVVFAVDYAISFGKTARGAHIAEIDLGGLSETDARAALDDLAVGAAGPVALRTDTGTAHIAPEKLGLRFDVEGTLDKLMEQPKNPWTRLQGMFGRPLDVAASVRIDRAALDEELDEQRPALEKAAVEGGVHYEGVTPVGDFPSAGMRIDRDAAVETFQTRWPAAGTIDLAMEPFDPTVSADTVRQTLAGPAQRAVSAPVELRGQGRKIPVSRQQLGAMVTFVPDGKGGLKPDITKRAAQSTLGNALAGTESSAVSASYSMSSGRPRVVPSRDGAKVKWPETAAALASSTLTDQRRTDVAYAVRKPKLDTARARKLGVKEVVSEFTTGDFSGPSGENIRLVAEKVNGAVVLPGETFSLNGYTGPRGAAQGYVSSTIIDHGRPSKAVGGGISQFATTLYNASYFAGLEDVTHTEHAYYISRYPEAREATVFEGLIDLQFKNNTDHGLLIETSWSSSSVTVKLWSTKTFDVESQTGERYDKTSPETVTLPAGDDCLPVSGAGGFTTSNTRIVRNHRTGDEVSRHTRTVRYAPEPIVRCR